MSVLSPPPELVKPQPSPGFWATTWKRYRRRPLGMLALGFVIFLGLISLFAPAIVGTRPVVCKYKGNIYFPCLAYFNQSWEPVIFHKDRFRKIYPLNLKKKDPESWAIWPLVYQDPARRIKDDEWRGQPGNEIGAKPTRYNLMGTTDAGFDVFAIMIHGTKIALLVGFVTTGIAAAIGITLGAIAGYFGGWTDILVSRFTEVVMSIPTLVIIIALLSFVKNPSIWLTMAVLGLTSWTSICRLTRAEFLKLRAMDYVAAARALGAGQARIMFRHILPNALAPILVPISFGIASAILIEAALSILGIGSPPDTPSWGNLLNQGRGSFESKWWLVFFPGFAVFLTVMAYNLIGEGIQEATDPRLREARK
jgi:peptide/nickel transport system permease protein